MEERPSDTEVSRAWKLEPTEVTPGGGRHRHGSNYQRLILRDAEQNITRTTDRRYRLRQRLSVLVRRIAAPIVCHTLRVVVSVTNRFLSDGQGRRVSGARHRQRPNTHVGTCALRERAREPTHMDGRSEQRSPLGVLILTVVRRPEDACNRDENL